MAMIDMGNSEKSKETKVEKKAVAKGTVVKETFGEKLYKSFIPDSPSEMLNRFVFDILIPSGKKALFDGLSAFLGMDSKKAETFRRTIDTVSGNRVYQDSVTPAIRRSYNVMKICFHTAEDALNVLNKMEAVIAQQRYVSVGDYYEFAEVGTITKEDFYYGWTDLRSAKILEEINQNGYILSLPPVAQLIH